MHVRRPSQQIVARTLRHDDYQPLALATGLGIIMARTALNILNRHPDSLTAISNAVRDLPVTSDKVDPDRRMWDAIEQLARLDAMVTRLGAAVAGANDRP
jgi:hypothetical protein